MQHLTAKRVKIMSRGAKLSVRHCDECRQRIMEALEAIDEGIMRTFLDKNAPRRPEPEIAGGGRCGASSRSTSSSGEDSRRSPEQQQRWRSSALTDWKQKAKGVHSTRKDSRAVQRQASSSVLEQRHAKTFRVELLEEPS